MITLIEREIKLSNGKIITQMVNKVKAYRKIYQKTTINNAMHIMECPECKSIEASASEKMYLPQFTSCSNQQCNF